VVILVPTKEKEFVPMRGTPTTQQQLFSYVPIDERIPSEHPMRVLREMVDPLLQSMWKQFDRLYSDTGRPSIAPEYLLRATLVQILYSIRSERLLMEQLEYNMLFRWFVGMSMDEEVWDHSVFSKNRERLLTGDIAWKFLEKVLALARTHQLLSDEHFTVDGTLIEAWAGHKSFQKKDAPASDENNDSGNPTMDFHGEQRTNQTHESTTDPESRLYRKGKGKEAKLSFMGHVVIDNRHGLVVATRYTQATGTAERDAAAELVKEVKRRRKRRLTLGADKGYDTRNFVDTMRTLKVTPHVAQNTANRSSAIDSRTTRHAGYDISQWKRKIVEEVFGWVKTIGLLRKTRHKGVARGGWMFTFTNAAYNLVRIKNILGGTT
jgi:transposase